jgi:hypothetical protein
MRIHRVAIVSLIRIQSRRMAMSEYGDSRRIANEALETGKATAERSAEAA